ncbi:MAG: ATP-binding cassette domain-containing protein [Clostridiales bacterium]|jgi:ABC-type lipoprotein export system ATPase subunit/ABC-type antimicrobial peptide transport system permease subunit|nr:ATP-binding cassette domain-containing protein [Clostridiales bacterium]
MVQLINVKKEYVLSDKKAFKVEALKNINLTFDGSGLVAVVGKSGSGKTTLMNLIGGLDKPTDGEILINGKNTSEMKNKDYDFLRSYGIGFVFQDYNLLSDLSVSENIKLAVKFQENDDGIISERTSDAMQKTGIEELKDRKINELSGGQQQRVAIARAIAKGSAVLLCDEPTGNLDSKTSADIIGVLKEVSKEKTVIVVTHDEETALNQADRLIRLKDGEVTEDSRISEISENPSESRATSTKYYHLRLRDAAAIIGNNLWRTKYGFAAIVLILAAAFTLFTNFYALSGYNSQDAFMNTLKHNDMYVFQLSKYYYEPRYIYVDGEPIISHGPWLAYEDSDINDIPTLEAVTGGKAAFYPSYFFNKNFQDFSDVFLGVSGRVFPYHISGFREAVAVADFSTFHMPLLYGELPKKANDILIYDYIADNMIYYGLFSGGTGDLVGRELTDRQTGLTFKIKGILKSNYKQYAYITESTREYTFEETYLTGLQTVYCRPEFITALSAEASYKSVVEADFFSVVYNGAYEEYVYNDYGGIKKIKRLSELPDDSDFIIKRENATRGVVLSLKELSEITGIEESAFTSALLEELVNSLTLTYGDYTYNWDIERSYYGYTLDDIYGIVADNALAEDGVVLLYEGHDRVIVNGHFRTVHISLGKNWAVNKEVMDNFLWVEHSEEFYEQYPNYPKERYTDYVSMGILVRDADIYLKDVKDFSDDIMLYTAILAVLSIAFFTFNTIKKNTYKVGVLKALGARNSDVTMIFGLTTVCLSLAAFILSIGVSFILMNRINYNFTKSINDSLVFFNIKATDLLVTFIIAISASILAALIPLIRLFFYAPITIIRNKAQ